MTGTHTRRATRKERRSDSFFIRASLRLPAPIPLSYLAILPDRIQRLPMHINWPKEPISAEPMEPRIPVGRSRRAELAPFDAKYLNGPPEWSGARIACNESPQRDGVARAQSRRERVAAE